MSKANLVYGSQALKQSPKPLELRVLRGSNLQAARKFNFKLRFMCALSIGMVLISLFCRIQLTELTEQINQSDKKLTVLESEELQLRTKLENDMNIYSLEEKASKLGMEKLHSYQVEYINISREDSVRV